MQARPAFQAKERPANPIEVLHLSWPEPYKLSAIRPSEGQDAAEVAKGPTDHCL